MPQSLTTIYTGGPSLAAVDCSDDTSDVTRTTYLLGRPYGFALDGYCAAAYACNMLRRLQEIQGRRRKHRRPLPRSIPVAPRQEVAGAPFTKKP